VDKKLLVVSATLFAGFIVVFFAMRAGYFTRFDEYFLTILRQAHDSSLLRGGAKFTQSVSDFTALGGLTVLFSLTLMISLYHAVRQNWRLCVVLPATVLSGYVLSACIKVIVSRNRPEVVPHLIPVHDASFPSGHAMVSAVAYITMGLLLALHQPTKAARYYVVSIAVLLVLVIGTSRIFLGVHFPSDVIAGWLLGSAWAVLCVAISRKYILKKD